MSASLRSMLAAGDFVVAPGVFEMFSAKIADRMDFKALYMTGYGISGSHLGLPDAGLVPAYDMQQLHTLVGFHDVSAFEQRHVDTKWTVGFFGTRTRRHSQWSYAWRSALQLALRAN